MAFRRRRFYRRFRRRNFRTSKVTKPVKRYVKSQLAKNIEYKYNTYYFGPSSIPNNGVVYNMISIAQGMGDTQRIGDTIKLKTITFKYSVTNADTYNITRLIIFQWKMNNSYPPTFTNVLNGTSPTVYSQYNVDNRQNFQVLYDRSHTTDADDPIKIVRGRINCKYAKKELTFYAGSASNGNQLIYALAISDSSASSHPLIEGEFNFWYTDA